MKSLNACALVIKPKPSRFIAANLLLIHLLTLCGCFWLFHHRWMEIVATICLAISLIWHYRREVLRVGWRCCHSVIWQSNGEWQIRTESGDLHAAELLDSSQFSSWMVVLHLRTHVCKNNKQTKQTRRLFLPYDSLPPELHRKLRQRLKLQNPFMPVGI